jgi:phosphate-selective porin OprO and OprP
MTIKTSRLLGGAAAGALIALSLGSAASAQDTTTAWAGAPRFTNDSLTFKVRGRVYLDTVFQDVDGSGTGLASTFSGTNTPDYDARNFRNRTARLGVEGTFSSDWAYKAEFTVQNGAANWEDLILEYKPDDYTSIMIGNYKTLGLEQITSSRYTTFMERGAYADVTDTGRVFNISAKRNGPNWTAQVAVSGGSINSADVAQGDERIGFNGRVTFAPVDTDFTKLHLGAWARQRDHGDEALFGYGGRPQTNYGNQFITTGAIGDKDTTFGLEGALVHKNFSVQAEYANINVERIGRSDADLTAYYAYVSWFITGETRRYEANRGEFNRTRILNPTTAGGWGAFEVALRYENADLGDAFIRPAAPAAITTTATPRAGEQESWTAGLNWYPMPYVRFMANYTMAEVSTPLVGNDSDVDTLQFRAQFDF